MHCMVFSVKATYSIAYSLFSLPSGCPFSLPALLSFQDAPRPVHQRDGEYEPTTKTGPAAGLKKDRLLRMPVMGEMK